MDRRPTMATSRLLVARVHGLAGRRAELRAALGDLAAAALGERGCRQFDVLELDDPGEHLLLVDWESEDVMRAHFATAHYRRYREAVGPLLARPSDVVVHHVAQTVRPVDPNLPDPVMFG
jgi:quinol monooxygenase YgiN